MNRIVCNTIDFVFTDEIVSMDTTGVPVLKPDKGWKRINIIEQPIYQSSIKQNDAGPTNEETVSAKGRKNNITELLIQYCGFHTVLRMSTDEEVFYVGNLEYPCTMEYTGDKIFDNYSFKAIAPA